MQRLSERLLAVAQFVTPGNRLADIGCDHGHLSIWLVESGRVPSAIAMDVRSGPLSAAENNIAACGLSDRIACRLSDGMKELKAGEADTAVMAGMGGRLILKILGDSPEVRASLRELVLEPQSEFPLVRLALSRWKYVIRDEKMICEENKYYPILRVTPSQNGESSYLTDLEIYFGPKLLGKRDPVLRRFLQKKKETDISILEKIDRMETGAALQRRAEVEEELSLIEQAEEVYQ